MLHGVDGAARELKGRRGGEGGEGGRLGTSGNAYRHTISVVLLTYGIVREGKEALKLLEGGICEWTEVYEHEST